MHCKKGYLNIPILLKILLYRTNVRSKRNSPWEPVVGVVRHFWAHGRWLAIAGRRRVAPHTLERRSVALVTLSPPRAPHSLLKDDGRRARTRHAPRRGPPESPLFTKLCAKLTTPLSTYTLLSDAHSTLSCNLCKFVVPILSMLCYQRKHILLVLNFYEGITLRYSLGS